MDRAPLKPADFASAVTAITSAFGDPTRRSIYLYARESDDGVTASEVAERFALHPNVARHHLDKLAGGGYLEVGVAAAVGARAGRPSKRYRLAARHERLELPEVRHDDLLVALLGRALSLLPPAAAESIAEDVGVEYGRSMARSVGPAEAHRSFQAALAMVADALSAHGFAAHAERRGNQLRIVSEHCPFGTAAIEHPVICAVDRGMVKGMLHGLYGEAEAATESSLPMGADVCVTAVRG
jgi:predicted ArsR family transcriptional regulator